MRRILTALKARGASTADHGAMLIVLVASTTLAAIVLAFIFGVF